MGVAIGYPLPLLLVPESETMEYYTVEELVAAQTKATEELNSRADFCEEYKTGFNDCMALLAVYDSHLRGQPSKAYTILNFTWSDPREFLIKLYRRGFTLPRMAQECGYEIIANHKPKVGDIGFVRGTAVLCTGSEWVSTKEDNTGVDKIKNFKEVDYSIDLIARPLRS